MSTSATRIARTALRPRPRAFAASPAPAVRAGVALVGGSGSLVCGSSRYRPLSTTNPAPAPPSSQSDDLAPPASTAAHNGPRASFDKRFVKITWESGRTSEFHHIWLRDHCRQPECFHPVTKQRLVDTFGIPPDMHPTALESSPSGLEVTWAPVRGEPPHVSRYPWRWLYANSYNPPLADEHDRRILADDEKILWSSRIASTPPKVSYEEVMRDDAGVFKWLRKIEQFGFCFIEGVPVNPEDTEKLARRIAFIRESHYGGFWDFTADLAHGDTAYTNLALKVHTDTTYFTDPIGLQLFHLLEAAPTGGHSLIVDGFYCASLLRSLHPRAYELLSTVRVPAHAAGDPDVLIRPAPLAGYPILRHDPVSTDLFQVRYNNDDRSAMRNIDPAVVEEWYDALRKWNEILTSDDSEYWSSLAPGTALIFDNWRVLHGRSAFEGRRRLCGAYINADDYRSRLAVLKERYAQPLSRRDEQQQEGGPPGGRDVWSEAF